MAIATNSLHSGAGSDERPVRAALMRKLCGDNLFALGAAVARVVELTSSDDEGTQSLAYYVLSDAALTQKILCLANTSNYRTAGGAPVTTVSRAISLLGFDNVKLAALAMLLVDTLANGRHARSVRIELEASLCASLVGREVARLNPGQFAEEASIGALFKNIGALLVASQEHERFREIGALMAAGHSQAKASQMILGCSFDMVSAAVLREWKIPDVIVRALGTLAPGTQKVALNRQEWLRQVASFGIEAAHLLEGKDEGGEVAGALGEQALALHRRLGAALGVSTEQLGELFSTVREEMKNLLQSMDLTPLAAGAHGDDGLPDIELLAALDDTDGPVAGAALAGGKPTDACDLLRCGLREVRQMRLSGRCKVNELIQVALETLYRAMGFRFATACLKDVKSGQYRGRLSFGERHAERQAGFTFSLLPENDLFHLAMERNADLMVADASDPKVRALLPQWHRALLPDARSFIVLPLVVQSVQLGLFYADRAELAPEGMSADETALIEALKWQVLIALTP
jgi:HD-like signal output (HDOD) protein